MDIKEMSIAALQGETVGQRVKTIYKIDDGGINHFITEIRQGALPLLRVARIFHEFFKLGKSFQ